MYLGDEIRARERWMYRFVLRREIVWFGLWVLMEEEGVGARVNGLRHR